MVKKTNLTPGVCSRILRAASNPFSWGIPTSTNNHFWSQLESFLNQGTSMGNDANNGIGLIQMFF